MALDIANGATHGQLALSYFDTEGRRIWVASRKVLEWEDADKAATGTAMMRFMTLVKLKAKWDVPLAFELKNPCKIVPQGKGKFLWEMALGLELKLQLGIEVCLEFITGFDLRSIMISPRTFIKCKKCVLHLRFTK